MIQALQVYKLAFLEWQHSILVFALLFEKTSRQHQQSSPQVDFGGIFGMHQPAALTTAFALADTARLEELAFYFGNDNYGLRPR